MKYVSIVCGILLGLLFLVASVPVLLHLMPEQKLPEGTPMAAFMSLMGNTGYMTFVKVCELIGGILVMIPRTRVWGLIILWPIILNILAFWAFVAHAVPNALTWVAVGLALGLLICARKAFIGLLNQ